MATSQDLPILAFATSGSRLLGLGNFLQAATLAGLRWIDLDLSGRIRWSSATNIARAASECGVNVRAVWLPSPPPMRAWIDRSTAIACQVGELVAGTGARAVVLDRPRVDSPHHSRQVRLLHAVRANVPPTARLTFALRPDDLVGTREHLRALAALRLVAEEWDVDLALDLVGPIDPDWESEAAVSKLLPRLTAVRVGPLESRPPGRGRARQSARVLSFLADLGYRGAIAIVAEAPLWRRDRAVSLARSTREAADAIVRRYESVRQPLWFDTSPQERERL
jgi:hypothetical protein